MRDAFYAKYGEYLNEQEKADALTVGNRRFMITVELEGPFANPLVYANPHLVPVLKAALGPNYVLDNFGVVVSLPGAEQQHMHRDGTPLFNGQLAGMIPVYALTTVFPLIEMNEQHGTTSVVVGTHRYRGDDADPEVPVIPEGSAVLWDYRLFHGGTPNRSNQPRPIVYLTYGRKWWRDADNYKSNKQRRLALPDGFLDTVPEEARHLFGQM